MQDPELTAKMPSFVVVKDRWLKGNAYQEWVLKVKLDKHYARCVASKFSSFFVVLTVAMVLTKIEYWSLLVLVRSLFGSSPSL